MQKNESLSSLVKRLGTPESTTLLHTSCSIFQIPEVDGVIAYHKIGNYAVVVGDPICLSQDIAKLTTAFHSFCEESQLKAVYLLANKYFADWAINNGCQTSIQVGLQLSIDPTNFKKKNKLKYAINRSIKHDVSVKEYKGFDISIENQMKNTIDTWVSQRRGPQMHLGSLNFLNRSCENRIFYAEKNDKIIGILMISPVDRYQGWVVTSYLALRDAPPGTTEHLMCLTFDTLAKEGCSYLCLGVASGIRLGQTKGLSFFHKIMANLFFNTARWMFKLDAKAIYLSKYQPLILRTFLLSKDKLKFKDLIALKNVLNVKL